MNPTAQAETTAVTAVDHVRIKSILDWYNNARMRAWLSVCARCGLCADSCFFYLAHDKDPAYSPAYKVKKTTQELYRKKGRVSRAWLEEAKEIVWGQCTLCRRCSMFCPFGIDLAAMLSVTRSVCDSQGVLPARLAETKANIIGTGNQMAMADEEFTSACEWMREEYEDEIKGLEIPIDREGARYMYTVNPREPMYYPQDIGMMAMIMTVAGESWTIPSRGWDCTNLAMFCGDAQTARIPVDNMYSMAQRLGVEEILLTECGHAYRSANFTGPYYLGLEGGRPPLPVKHAVELFWEYIVRDGRIKIDPAKKINTPVTVQDPCNISRNGGMWEMLRDLVRALCEDFRDMSPNREYNHCCGGGGGFIPMGPEYKSRRMASGRVKAEQIRETGARIVISPCHNCYDQLNDLNKEYSLDVEVVSFKELILKSMIVPERFVP